MFFLFFWQKVLWFVKWIWLKIIEPQDVWNFNWKPSKSLNYWGLEPQIITYNASISACQKADRWQEAGDLVGVMDDGVTVAE